jgi:5-methylcytosine-specific restriction enzyme subunit McrC
MIQKKNLPKPIKIREYDSFVSGEKTGKAPINGYITLKKATFDALENFILENKKEKPESDDPINLLKIYTRKGLGRVITAQNYVGVIMMKDGTTIEILPKIAHQNENGESGLEDSKKVFLTMLKTVDDLKNFKRLNTSSLDFKKMNIYEVFITMFVDEVSQLTKQGLKSSYSNVEENQKFFKGKLLVDQNIRHNLIRKDRFYVSYDEFNVNRPENKLIKSTLNLLLGQSQINKNQRRIIEELNKFDGVDFSINYDSDLLKCQLDRSTANYINLISWCKLFLKGQSFTSFSGSQVATALLFPMEKLFESYIAKVMKKHAKSNIKIISQSTQKFLFEIPEKKFQLKPDLIIYQNDNKINQPYLIIDTKWKLLADDPKNNYKISQADMYQMYAYSKKYNVDNIVLLSPKPEKEVNDGKPLSYKEERNGTTLSTSGLLTYLKWIRLSKI